MLNVSFCTIRNPA